MQQQLLSILNQTCLPAEIIVSDDGSTDGTLFVIRRTFEEWSRAHAHGPEIRYLHNSSQLGVTANFEQALAASSGELIALSDQDDIWVENRLERMRTEFVHRPQLALLHADARLVDEVGEPLGTTLLETLGVGAADRAAIHSGGALDVLLRRNVVTGATVMLRREVFDHARPFPAAWVHDEWLAIVAAATGVVDVLEVSLTDYRQHGANQIGVTRLDATGRFGRLKASRTARNARLRARAEVLAVRAPAFDPRPNDVVLCAFEEKLRHEDMRADLPAKRLGRIWPVLRAWRQGGYKRFGLGAQDMLRDLVQPV